MAAAIDGIAGEPTDNDVAASAYTCRRAGVGKAGEATDKAVAASAWTCVNAIDGRDGEPTINDVAAAMFCACVTAGEPNVGEAVLKLTASVT